MTEAGKVTVIDADRELSAEMATVLGCDVETFMGTADVLVQLVAKHRTDATRDLVEVLERLEKAATKVCRLGAQTGSQWLPLAVAAQFARAALTKAST